MAGLDRTGSMCQDSSGANDPTCFDLNNAKPGIRTFLSFMDKSVDAVGLAVLPPAATAAATCSTPSGASYNSSGAPYLMVPLSQDYKLKDGSLNSSSSLLSTLNCIKGGGTTSYASAIDVAQAALVAHGRAGVQKAIIFLSDGAANTGPSFLSKTPQARAQPCHAGITAASSARRAGTVVYSIGYALADDTGGCKADTGRSRSPRSPSGRRCRASPTQATSTTSRRPES
jgi:von Willebrand factor type A domain